MNLLRRLAPTLLLAPLCTSQIAYGNGRFPQAQHVVIGPGERSDTVAVRTTFGLLASFDGGRSFGWICEEALYEGLSVGSKVDPALELVGDGRLALGFESGVRSVPDRCNVRPHPSADGRVIADLAADPLQTTVWAIESARGSVNHVLRASGTDLVFRPLGEGVLDTVFTTLDVAPSRPQRLYAAGRDARTYAPRFFRSDDGGEHLESVTGDTLSTAEDPYVSGVDPMRPDTVWVRAGEGAGSVLLRSEDGGAHWRAMARSRGPMLGFALDATGRTVWYGGPADGIYRSDDGGERFVRVSTLGPLCLRHHAGALWACADWLRAPFSLGRSRDGGANFEPVLRFEDLGAPGGCAPTSRVAALCVPRWPAIRQVLATRDAGAEGMVDAAGIDAPPLDVERLVTHPRDRAVPLGGCGCRVGQRPPEGACAVGLWGIAVGVVRRRRRAHIGQESGAAIRS